MRRQFGLIPLVRFGVSLCLAALFLLFTGPAVAPVSAQDLFSPVLRVNDKAITRYELNQRARLLQALGASGDTAEDARERLIDERLQVQAAEELGITATDEAITEGIAEFASRANVTPEEFLATISRAGVSEQTFRDFVVAGVLWREVVRIRFGPRAQVSEEDVDRAVALAGSSGGARVLLSEIILPARTPEEAAAAEARAAQFSQIEGFAAFAQTARDFSASASRARGGRIDWLPLGALPPDLRGQLLTMPPGAVTDPVRIPNAIAVFQLRALEEVPAERPETIALDFATFIVPSGGPDAARAVADEVDTCDDLYGIAQGLPEERLQRVTLPPAEVPADIAAELQNLDAGEYSVALSRGPNQLLLMLCGRTTEITEGLDRAEVRRQLLNQRLGSYATGYLAELRADAVIIEVQ